MNVTAMVVVGALGATVGTGLVLYLVLWMDHLTTPPTPAVAVQPNARSASAPHRKAA
jgi:hypothetical protein